MASITKLPSGAYRVQIRRKGRYATETFLRRDDAQKWARQAETMVDQGRPPSRPSGARLHTFGDLVDLHIADMYAVGKPPRRRKSATLALLKSNLGCQKIGHLDRRMLLIRDRKDPRNKVGNDQRIPLFAATGFDAWALVLAQAKQLGKTEGPIFPYISKSVGTAFRRACTDVDLKDLDFHDLRHEGTSRLFEFGLSIEQVALVTGHKDWKMLRRYTHIRPEALHRLAAARPPYPTENFAS